MKTLHSILFRFLFSFGILIAIISLGLIGFYAWKGWETVEKVQLENPTRMEETKDIASLLSSEERIQLRGESDGRINILLLGRAGEHYPGKNLTDTVIIASIDTRGNRVGFLSLPRDLYVPIPNTDLFTKLNSLYPYGLDAGNGITTVTDAVEIVIGQPIHYFITLDFDSFKAMIDALGGIRVENFRDIHDTRYPGLNYSYETFELPAGWHTFDGATALKYVRERHDDPEGDFGRAKRQQQVIQAIREKAFSLSTLFNPVAIHRFLNALGDGVRTDLSLPEIASLAELIKTVDTKNVSTVVIDAWKKESLLRVDHIQVGSIRAFILVPRTGNWNEIHTVAEELFETDARKKREMAIASESARIAILAPPEDTNSATAFRQFLMDTYGFTTVKIITDRTITQRKKGAIKDTTRLKKPYTLDELLGNFELERADDVVVPEIKTLVSEEPFDFFVFFGDNLKQVLATEKTLEEESGATTDDPFSEYLEPQKR